MKRFLILLLLLTFIGCQSATDQTVTPIAKLSTVIPSSVAIRETSTLVPTLRVVDQTDEPTQTPTRQPTAVATQAARTATRFTATGVPPTAEPIKTVTNQTATTESLTPTNTSSPSPIPPSITPTPADEPSVNFFRFARPLTKPSQPTLLEWDVQGVETVTISRNGGEWAEAGQQWNGANRDSMEHTFPASVGGWPITYVLTSPDAPNLRSEFTITIPCEYDWEFDFDYAGNGCPVEAIISTGAFQAFEDGFMLWTQQLDQILYSTWDGLTHDEVIDSFNESSDPIRLTEINPPSGYLQPEYGFGKLWRNDDALRQTLGWAVGQPINFTTIRQSEPGTRYGNYQAFISLPNDRLITINVPDPFWSISYPKPDVPRAVQRPPLVLVSTTPPAPDEITVNYLRFATQIEKPSTGTTLEWDVDGVETVEIVRTGGEWNDAHAIYELSADGTLPQTFIPELGGWPIFYMLTACNEEMCVEEMFSAELPCEYPTIIDTVAEFAPCLLEGLISNGSQQNFENGFMIWIESADVILYSTWDGFTHAELVDTYEHEVDLIKDDTIIPPDGFYQPEYGFGKVWRLEAGVRELLGWATDWGTSYTVKRQSQPLHRYGFSEWITMKNDGLITINHPNPSWVIE